jgi:hypothetical protein
MGEIFRTCPDRPWGPPSFLCIGYRVFPEGKAAGAWHWPPTSCIAEVKERVELYLSLHSGPSWPVLGWTWLYYNYCVETFPVPVEECCAHSYLHSSMTFFLLTEMCFFLFQMRLEVSVYQPYNTHTASLPKEQNWALGPCQLVQILYA